MTQPCRLIMVDADSHVPHWSQALGLTAPLARAVLADCGVPPRAAVCQAVVDAHRLRDALPWILPTPGWRLRLCQHDQYQLIAILENRGGRAPAAEFIRLIQSLEVTAPAPGQRSGKAPPSVAKTVLLVEDDPLVRSVCRRILGDRYLILEAASSAAALTLGEWFPLPVDLLISDVNLPKMDGIALANRWLQRSPKTRVLLLSGSFLPENACTLPAIFLQKPFRAEELLHCTELMLGAPAA